MNQFKKTFSVLVLSLLSLTSFSQVTISTEQPATSTNSFLMYADTFGLGVCPHFETSNGKTIRLYESSAISATEGVNEMRLSLETHGLLAPSPAIILQTGTLTHAAGNGNTIPASATVYGQFGYGNSLSATESLRQNFVVSPCTIKNLWIRTQSAQPSSGSLVITIRYNGGASSLTTTIPANSPAGTYYDLTNSLVISSDAQLISIEFKNNATTTSADVVEIVCGQYH